MDGRSEPRARHRAQRIDRERAAPRPQLDIGDLRAPRALPQIGEREREQFAEHLADLGRGDEIAARAQRIRSEEHTSELQSLMRISYAVLCLKKKQTTTSTQ